MPHPPVAMVVNSWQKVIFENGRGGRAPFKVFLATLNACKFTHDFAESGKVPFRELSCTRKLVMFTNALMLSGSLPIRLLLAKTLFGARAAAGQQNGQ